jgi:hypothetical protein
VTHFFGRSQFDMGAAVTSLADLAEKKQGARLLQK